VTDKQWSEAIDEYLHILEESGRRTDPARLGHYLCARRLCHQRLAALRLRPYESIATELKVQAKKWFEQGKDEREPRLLRAWSMKPSAADTAIALWICWATWHLSGAGSRSRILVAHDRITREPGCVGRPAALRINPTSLSCYIPIPKSMWLGFEPNNFSLGCLLESLTIGPMT